MKFTISSKSLLSHLSAVSKVVNSKNKLSILDNFLFELEGFKLVITGSDQETTLTTNVEVEEADGNGKFAANVKNMLDIVKQLPDTGLTFTINDETLEINISYQNGEFNFVGINGDEFPVKSATDEEPKVMKLPVKNVVDGISHTLFAVGTDDMRPQMMGVYWDIKPEELVFVATDTHKLVRYRELDVQPGLEFSFILPTKPASILSSIFEKEEGDVTITTDSKSATFETAGYSLSCRFVNGRFPKYDSVIPQENTYQIDIDRNSLLNALRRVSVFTSSSGLVKMEFRPEQIFITTQDVDYSTSAQESVACDYNGDVWSIGFNDENIIDVLGNLTTETVTLKLNGNAHAGVFEPAEQEDGRHQLVLLMPMMI